MDGTLHGAERFRANGDVLVHLRRRTLGFAPGTLTFISDYQWQIRFKVHVENKIVLR